MFKHVRLCLCYNFNILEVPVSFSGFVVAACSNEK